MEFLVFYQKTNWLRGFEPFFHFSVKTKKAVFSFAVKKYPNQPRRRICSLYSATWQISGKLVMTNRLMFRENLLLLFQNVVAKNLPMDHFEDQVDVNATQDRTNVDAQRHMANQWKTRYDKPVDVPRELITAISKCGCKKSSDGSF